MNRAVAYAISALVLSATGCTSESHALIGRWRMMKTSPAEVGQVMPMPAAELMEFEFEFAADGVLRFAVVSPLGKVEKQGRWKHVGRSQNRLVLEIQADDVELSSQVEVKILDANHLEMAVRGGRMLKYERKSLKGTDR